MTPHKDRDKILDDLIDLILDGKHREADKIMDTYNISDDEVLSHANPYGSARVP